MWDEVLREDQHVGMGLDNCRLHELVRAVFRRNIGFALPCTSVVCVYRFPPSRDLRWRVTKLEDEGAECQTDRAQSRLEAEEAQENNDEPQTQPFRAREKNACRKEW